MVDAGYDMLLTANNHAYDTLMTGITRTLEQVRGAGLAAIGTRLSEEENRYEIVDVNGIRIGMICYTYTSGLSDQGVPRLNGNSPVEKPNLVNWFHYRNPDKMYGEVEQILADMEEEGVDATMMFIHWGNEYEIKENQLQRTIAQELCDIGFDVIVGGHAHVVQPIDLLESTVDPEHKTVCIYSLGNAVSNQRSGISDKFPTGYTEDGVIFSVTFDKYSDGSVYLSTVDVHPTWVNMHSNNGSKEYNILPLKRLPVEEWDAKFGLQAGQKAAALRSYERTMGILEEGLTEVQDYLTQQRSDREAYYLAQVGLG